MFNFVGMVLPGDEFTVKHTVTAMRDGNFVVGVTTIEMVLRWRNQLLSSTPSLAKVRRSRAWEWTCITLPWRPVSWDYSTIHFDGIKRCERCIENTYDTTDKDSNIKNLPLFADTVSTSARFNTLSRIQKDFFSPLDSHRSPLLLRDAQLSKTYVRKVWSGRAPPSMATH